MARCSSRPIAFIAAASAALLALGACGDATTETDTSRLGADCAGQGDAACAGGYCFVLDTQTAYCTRVCAKAADCPPEYSCQSAPALGKVCLLRSAGGACEGDEHCPAGHRCDAAAQKCYIPVSRTLCAPCTSDKQCPVAGSCLRIGSTEETFCTVGCEGGCPEGHECQEVGKATPQCAPRNLTCNLGKTLCAPCKGDNECGGALDLCVQNLVSAERFCSIDCTNEPGKCPAGFTCQDLSGQETGPYQCVPNSTTCEGYCDEPDPARAERQCGLGRICDLDRHECVGALDGRLCSPCQDDDGCGNTPGAHCVSNRFSGETFCGEDCQKDPSALCPSDGCTADQTKCPRGFTCLGVGNNNVAPFQCVPNRGTCLAGTGGLGDDCTAQGADECLTGQCLKIGAASVCTQSCATPADCGERYLCCADSSGLDCSREPQPSERGICVPAGGQFGADCSPGQSLCLSGLCLDMGTARLCTNACSGGTCLPGFKCRDAIGAEAEIVPVCFPDGGGEVGADCSFGPAACADGVCLKKGTGNICSRRCAANEQCPDDWACTEGKTVENATIQACVPGALVP